MINKSNEMKVGIDNEASTFKLKTLEEQKY